MLLSILMYSTTNTNLIKKPTSSLVSEQVKYKNKLI